MWLVFKFVDKLSCSVAQVIYNECQNRELSLEYFEACLKLSNISYDIIEVSDDDILSYSIDELCLIYCLNKICQIT